MDSDLLVILLLIPAAGALIGALLPVAAARSWALLVALATLIVSIVILAHFPFDASGFQFLFSDPNHLALPFGASFSLGIDAISLWLVLLTALLMPLAIAASFQSIKDRPREYYAWMLLLQAAMLGVFISRDILVFYIFFELTLIPMFFIIGIWGGPQRRYAAGKFFLFTFTGSVFTLAGAIYLGYHAGSFDISTIVMYARDSLSATERYWVLLALLAGFAVKVPLFPVHTWLPLAHTEAPTAGSVILAGVLLKLGTYGLLRLALPIGLITTDAVAFPKLIHFLGYICVIGVIYGALVAWVQQDIKKLVAYSSVSHLGFCVLGMIALNTWGIEGSVLYMINHGLSTGALFLVVGMIYDRFHTRDINQLSGLARRMPRLAFFFVLFTLASIGLPGLNGFVSEFLTILGAFTSQYLGAGYGSFAALGIILGAVYMLHMASCVIWGPLKFPEVHEEHAHDALPTDIGAREVAILIPLALAVVFLGVYPSGLLRSMNDAVTQMQPLTAQVSSASHGAPKEDSGGGLKRFSKNPGPNLAMSDQSVSPPIPGFSGKGEKSDAAAATP
jgi:NADH-quinone oxidoreductase subunit M